jgi:hypothetical protein
MKHGALFLVLWIPSILYAAQSTQKTGYDPSQENKTPNTYLVWEGPSPRLLDRKTSDSPRKCYDEPACSHRCACGVGVCMVATIGGIIALYVNTFGGTPPLESPCDSLTLLDCTNSTLQFDGICHTSTMPSYLPSIQATCSCMRVLKQSNVPCNNCTLDYGTGVLPIVEEKCPTKFDGLRSRAPIHKLEKKTKQSVELDSKKTA